MFCFEITLGELINCIVLIFTAYLIWKYTSEAQKSNEIQERPILNLYLKETQAGLNIIRRMCVKNVGNGPAYNVIFEPICAEDYVYYPQLEEPNPILEIEGEEKYVRLYVSTPTGGRETADAVLEFQRFMERLFPKETPESVQDFYLKTRGLILIHYDGLGGKKYYSIFRISSTLKWPFSPEVLVEFIENGKGKITVKKATEICASKTV